MIQASINDAGDLYFTFKDTDNQVVSIHRLLNAGELEFIDDECVGLELLNFEQQLNRGKINNVELIDAEIKEDNFIFHIVVDGQSVNGRVNLSSTKDKL